MFVGVFTLGSYNYFAYILHFVCQFLPSLKRPHISACLNKKFAPILRLQRGKATSYNLKYSWCNAYCLYL